MTQYAYQPQLADVDTTPADWTLTWDTTDGPWLVKDDGTGVACFRPAVTPGHPGFLWTGASGPGMVADCQIYIKVSKKVSSNNAFAVARGQLIPQASGPAQGYFAGMEWFGSSGYGQRIRRPPTSTSTSIPITLASAASAYKDFTKKTHILMTVSGSTITVKTWDEGQNEATQAETLTYNAATEWPAAGYVGFTTWEGSSVAGSETRFYFIGVGTGGDAAPRSLPTPTATLALTDAGDTAAIAATSPVMAVLARIDAGDLATILGRTPVLAALARTDAADVAAIVGRIGSAIRLQFGITKERGAEYASATGLRYVVFNAALNAAVAAGSNLSTDAGGVVTLDLNGTAYNPGDYVPVLVTEYNAALAPQARVVRTMFGFIPATAAP